MDYAVSRRGFLAGSATLLASFGLPAAQRRQPHASRRTRRDDHRAALRPRRSEDRCRATTNRRHRVLPTTYGDNYFWLLPGESRTVSVTPRRRSPGAKLLVEAYNSAAVVVP